MIVQRLSASFFLTWSAPAFILGAAMAVYVNFSVVTAFRDKADGTADALSRIEVLVSTLKDAETGERGFLLTGDDAYLEPYEHALAALRGDMAAVAALAGSDPARGRMAATIETLTRDRLEHLRRAIELRRTAGLDAALDAVRTGEGKRLMDAIRAESAALQEDVRRELAAERERNARMTLVTDVATLASGALAVFVLALVAAARRRIIGHQALSIEALSHDKELAEFDRLSMGTLLDALPVGVFVADSSGRVLRANAVAERIWGGVPRVSDIAAYGAYRAWWADTGRPIAAEDWAIPRALRTGETSMGEVIDIRRFDGSNGTILHSAAPVRDLQGRVLGAVAVLQDITEHRRIEQALRESEARLRLVIDEAPLPIMVHAEDGEVVQLSRAWTEASGYSREEIPTVAAWAERAYGAAAGRALAAVREAHDFTRGRYEGGEYTVRVADGSMRPWLFRAAPVGRDHKGRRLLVSMAMDLTEIRHTEAALKESETRYRAVVDTAADPIVVIDEKGTIQSFNRAAERLFGYSGAEVIGQNVSALMPEPHRQAHDSYLERYGATGEQRIIGSGREVEGLHRDGSVFPLHLTVAEWWTAGQRFFTGIMRDLTEQKRQEAAVRQAAERQAAILDALPEHVALLDADGTIVAVNEAWRRFGAANGLLRPGDCLGDNYLAVCDRAAAEGKGDEAQDAAGIGAALRAVLAGERKRFAIDYSCHAPDEQRWFRCIAAPATRVGRRGAVIMHVDITEAKRREDALRQAQKLDAIGQLTSSIAHDFNNYLTVISGNLERLQQACADTPKAARIIALSQAAAERAEHLVKQLLGFSRRQPLQPESLDFNRVATELQELLQRALRAGIELQLILEPELWIARADRNQLETALLNLVVNARDAIAEGGGWIKIRTANVTLDTARAGAKNMAPGDYVEVSVADTGLGMSSAVLAHAFEPFFTTKARGKGSGLGLSQIYGFAKRSNGSVEIDTREGAGTTVRLLLPRDVAREEPPA
jgi:PAS domain S-box-containing protein